MAQILPYVNGTLYSLLTNPKIAASARSLHISEKLKLAITATANDPDLGGFDDEAKQQISFVLQQYEESSSSSDSSSLASSMATMSSLSDDGYEEDEESNVSKKCFEIKAPISNNEILNAPKYMLMKCGLFEPFLYVEQQFIPKKLIIEFRGLT